MSDSHESQSPGLLANILAVAGFIILIVIIVWGAYHLLRLTGAGISSLFSNTGTEIQITTPTTPVESGKAFPLAWDYSPSEDGNFAVLYQCKAGFRFETNAPSRAALPCGNAINVGGDKTINLVPVLTGTTTLDVPVSVVFVPAATSSTERPQGATTVKVTGGSTTATPAPTNSGSTGSATTPRPAAPAGKPDLSVRILSVGTVNAVTGAIENRYPGPEEIAAVQFDIANNGTGSTGSYAFTVSLPIQGGYVYTSPAQNALTPGSHIVNTLRFKPVQSGGGTVTVSVDPYGAVNESNESNNTGTIFIGAPMWTGSYAPYVY